VVVDVDEPELPVEVVGVVELVDEDERVPELVEVEQVEQLRAGGTSRSRCSALA
jgi:hypothetical protein